MADYDNKLSGALFKNDKVDNPKRPDYKGSYTDGNGNEFWVSAWVKKDKNDKSYMSLSMQPKEDQEAPSTASVSNSSDDSGDLPF